MLLLKIVLRKDGLWSLRFHYSAYAVLSHCSIALQPSWHATAEVEQPSCSTPVVLSLSLEHNLDFLKVFFLLLTFIALVSFI